MKKESSIAYLNKQATVTFLLLLVIVLPLTAEAQQRQHLTKYFEGIPVINNTYMGFWGSSNQYHYDSMKAMGVNLFWNGINNQELNFLYSKGIKLVPINTRDNNNKVYQWVQYYCDAKYTVWEAEGTNDSEDAGLYRDTGKTEIITGDTTFVRTVPFAQTSKIIYGPYYLQENDYVVKIFPNDYRPVEYIADFELMLQKNDEYPQTDTTVYLMTEPICSLQVTTSKIVYRDNNWVIDSVFIIKDTLLTRGSFSNLNTFIKFPLQYTLANIPKEFTTTKYRNNTEGVMWSGESTNNIEFKVIWLGREKYRLSADKITVYDYRGLELKNQPEVADYKISSEINVIRNSPAYDSTVLGWHGIDEVVSIDNFEPIRIVAGILKQQDLRLYLPMMGFWNGTWENGHFVKNPYGSNGLSPWKVLKKRTNSFNLHIWQNAYFLSPGDTTKYWPFIDLSRLEPNLIARTAFIYNKAKEFDKDFGVSILVSAQNNPPTAYFIDPSPETVLYNVNLGLMLGAKYFDLYTYFARHRDIDTCRDSIGTYTGLVNSDANGFHYFTNKWYMWRYKLTQRLNGLLGRTIKKLDALPVLNSEGFLVKINFGISYKFIQQIVNTNSCTAQTTDGSNDVFDLGFFTDSSGKDYFMLISRYYNSDCNPTLRIYFNQSYFQPYRNLNLKNFITGVSTTKLINQYLPVVMDKGDAVFYGVWPVVKHGGDLIANDTIKSNTILFDDMTIKDNVKLVIDRGKYYTITDTVTLEGTGFITGAGYLNIEQNGTINITNWNQSVFKGRQVNNPKIIWGRYPTIGTVTQYRIFRAKGNNQFIQIAEVDSTKRQYIDSTTIIYDRPEANLTYADYYVRAVYQPSGNAPLSTSTNSNTIRYDMVDGIAADKLAMNSPDIITEYRLEQNYPNPFNPTTVISWQSPKGGHQTLKVYDILGNEIATLVDEYREAGRYNIEFDASKLASGVYIYRLSAGYFVDVKKMIVVK